MKNNKILKLDMMAQKFNNNNKINLKKKLLIIKNFIMKNIKLNRK